MIDNKKEINFDLTSIDFEEWDVKDKAYLIEKLVDAMEADHDGLSDEEWMKYFDDFQLKIWNFIRERKFTT